MKKFTIALNVDDVLAPCVEPGCRELGIDPQRITPAKKQASLPLSRWISVLRVLGYGMCDIMSKIFSRQKSAAFSTLW